MLVAKIETCNIITNSLQILRLGIYTFPIEVCVVKRKCEINMGAYEINTFFNMFIKIL